MYAAYKINFSRGDKTILENYPTDYEGMENYAKFDQITKHVNNSGLLQMTKLAEDWFPKVDTQVFISHSHQDEKLACQLANYLQDNFGIKSFIDGKFWGYSMDALKNIDNQYCVRKDGLYDYATRNQTTAHIHMMLATSLTKMMDKCECVIFLDTDNSKYTNDSGDICTRSVWINLEIYLSGVLQTRKLIRPPSKKVVANEGNQKDFVIFDSMFGAEFVIDISKLPIIEIQELAKIKEIRKTSSDERKDFQFYLDKIYEKFPPNTNSQRENF